MPDEAVSLRDINWRETFPFTHLFRAFRIAIHPSKLVLALVALGCLWLGGSILDAVWSNNSKVLLDERVELGYPGVPKYFVAPRNVNPLANPEYFNELRQKVEQRAELERNRRDGVFHTFFDYEVTKINNVLMFKGGAYSMIESVWQFIAVGPLLLWSHHWFFAFLFTCWFLLIWSVFGGAIARIAAVHVARDEKISVRHALTFSVSKVLSFIFAPVIPVAIVLGIGFVIALASTILLHIPWIGPIIAGLFYCLALLGGFVIALVMLGTIGGFNLMYPTVAVEGSDSFDAISRSFSYVFARPWRMLWYTAVSIVYGAICYLFVRFFVWIMLAVTWFFMSWFLGHYNPDGNMNRPANFWPVMWPQPGLGPAGSTDPNNPLVYRPGYETLRGSESVAAGLIAFWNYIVIGLIGSFAISFYFSANSIIYYLMRREVDATELDDVYVEEADDDVEEPPAAPSAATATKIRETSTVRVYETEEGAPAPAESAPTSAAPEPPAGQ